MEREAELIMQIINGRSDLFEQIVLHYQNLVYSVCLNILRNPEDAENMAQEAFLTAYSSLSDYRGDNFKSWLCRIAANKSIDCKRKDSRRGPVILITETDGAAESVEESFLRKEREAAIKTVLSELPEKYSSVIDAFYYGGLTVKEIADKLKLPDRTVETRLYRAKKLLRERMETDGA